MKKHYAANEYEEEHKRNNKQPSKWWRRLDIFFAVVSIVLTIVSIVALFKVFPLGFWFLDLIPIIALPFFSVMAYSFIKDIKNNE